MIVVIAIAIENTFAFFSLTDFQTSMRLCFAGVFEIDVELGEAWTPGGGEFVLGDAFLLDFEGLGSGVLGGWSLLLLGVLGEEGRTGHSGGCGAMDEGGARVVVLLLLGGVLKEVEVASCMSWTGWNIAIVDEVNR